MKKEFESRRDFFKKAAGTAAGLAGISFLGPSCTSADTYKKTSTTRPRIVIAKDPGIWDTDSLNLRRVQDLVFSAVRELAGTDSDREAWRKYFNPGENVSIKLNCLAGKRLSSTPEVTLAIVNGLKLAGIKPGRIVAWDRTNRELQKAGFTPGDHPSGAIFAGTDSRDAGYDKDLTITGEVGSLVSRIASVFSDAIVNVPVLKDHDLAGVSGCMKNYFGAIHNPNKLHENGCDPYVADLNTMPVFRDKTRLIIYDATTAQYHGGPAFKSHYSWKFSGVIVGTDPVAIDSVAHKLIEEKRMLEGKPGLAEEGRYPHYIDSAAHSSRALGENNLDNIDIIEI